MNTIIFSLALFAVSVIFAYAVRNNYTFRNVGCDDMDGLTMILGCSWLVSIFLLLVGFVEMFQ